MDSKNLFKETQLLRDNKLSYVIFLVILGVLFTLVYLIKSGDVDFFSAIILPLILLVLISILTGKYDITVTKERICINYTYLLPKKEILIKDIKRITVKTYDPINDFGGYGFRKRRNATLYSTQGNTAIVIEDRSGKLFYLGTQKALKLKQIIDDIMY